MRRFYTKQDFLAKGFSLPPLSTFEYWSGYLPFISYSTMIEYLCKEMLAKSIERSEIEPNRTPIVRLTFIASVIEHNRAHPKLLPIELEKSNNLAIEHDRTFGNGSFKNCTQIKFHLVSQQAKELLLTNKLCVSFNWT